MSYRLPNLNWLRAFEAAARHGTFTAAADEVGLTQAAVSHQVRALESTLGFKLFSRKARSLELTAMGEAYLPIVRKAIEELAVSTQGLFGARGRKTVTVRSPISTTVCWLAPRLKDFRALHPDINVRLLSSIWGDIIVNQDVDVDLRLGDGMWAGLHAELVSRETVTAICARDVAPRLAGLGDLKVQGMIQILGFRDHWARLFQGHGIDYDPSAVTLACDTTIAAVELVAACGGVAMIMRRLARALAARGRIVIPFDVAIELEQSHYLVTAPGGPPSSAEAETFRRWLRGEFARDSDPATAGKPQADAAPQRRAIAAR